MSTDCPLCGASGRIANLALLSLYRCTNWKCRAEYFVQRNKCQRCRDDIADDREYCDFHAYLGDDPPRPAREDYCTICLNERAKDSDYCTEHRDQFEQEHQDFMRQCREDYEERTKDA